VSDVALLVVFSPFLGLCVVMLVALLRARTTDIPVITATFVDALVRLVERRPKWLPGHTGIDTSEEER
jgi:hypothetical protein